MSDGFDSFPLDQDPVVLIPKVALPGKWPGMNASRFATYIAVRSFTWRKSAVNPGFNCTAALVMVGERFGQSPATVARNLAWLEEQYLVPPDVIAWIWKPGNGGGDGR